MSGLFNVGARLNDLVPWLEIEKDFMDAVDFKSLFKARYFFYNARIGYYCPLD